MAIDKVTDILSRPISQEKVREATSGKKEKIREAQAETRRTSLDEMPIFSEDAKKLQETEVILQNALQKLHEMDEVNAQNLQGIIEKVESNLYDSDEVREKVASDIFPEEQLRTAIEKRLQAERYIDELNDIDSEPLDLEKLNKIKEKIDSGFYDSEQVINAVASALADSIDI